MLSKIFCHNIFYPMYFVLLPWSSSRQQFKTMTCCTLFLLLPSLIHSTTLVLTCQSNFSGRTKTTCSILHVNPSSDFHSTTNLPPRNSIPHLGLINPILVEYIIEMVVRKTDIYIKLIIKPQQKIHE